MPRPRGHKLSRPAWDDITTCAGVSLTQVAARADIPRVTLSALYGGQSRASLPTTTRLAAALGCQPATLFPTLLPIFEEAAAS